MAEEADQVVLSYFDSLIRKSDIHILKGPMWLSDAVIGFYFEYLQREKYKDNNGLLFVSPEVTQCLKVTPSSEVPLFLDPLNAKEKQVIFMALNDCVDVTSPGGSHWSLLVYSKKEDSFYHADSYNGSNCVQAKKLANNLSGYLNSKKPECNLCELHVVSQENSYDCGVHLLYNVDNIAEHVVSNKSLNNLPLISKDCVDGMRRKLLNLIKQLSERH